MTEASAPAGWYDDPEKPEQQRYWDGLVWTEHRAASPAVAATGVAAQPMDGKRSKAFLVIGIVALVLLLACGGCGVFGAVLFRASDESATSTETGSSTSGSGADSVDAPTGVELEEGTYRVGSDLEAGEYLVIADDGKPAYVEVMKNDDGSSESTIGNANFRNRSYITVNDGEYLEVSDAKVVSIAGAPKAEAVDGRLPQGMYKVGVDLEAGEYTLFSEGEAFYELSSDSRHNYDSTVTVKSFEGSTNVTLNEGRYIILSGATLELE